jgi:hypothetical protein
MGFQVKRWVGVVLCLVVIGSLLAAGYVGYVLNQKNSSSANETDSSGSSSDKINDIAGEASESSNTVAGTGGGFETRELIGTEKLVGLLHAISD